MQRYHILLGRIPSIRKDYNNSAVEAVIVKTITPKCSGSRNEALPEISSYLHPSVSNVASKNEHAYISGQKLLVSGQESEGNKSFSRYLPI